MMASSRAVDRFDYRAAGERAGVRCEAEAPLSRYTTLGVGGPAAWIYFPRTAEAAAGVYDELLAGPLPVRVLGGGSNVIVDDEGVRAAVVSTRELRDEPYRLDDRRVRALAGQPLPGLARWCCGEGLSGLEFAEGIPGQVGGAVRMNAGAHGGWMGDVVRQVLVAAPGGEVAVREVEAESFGYRESFVSREGLFALGAVLRLEPDQPQRIKERMKRFKDRRRASQPVTERSAGCVFANPSEEPAGALIDRLGLKGVSVGGAMVSGKHGNFVVNHAGATAADVLALLDRLRDALTRELGSEPRLEVEIWRDA
jgi:UDP-N-acetylmuramate dehydrogenase